MSRSTTSPSFEFDIADVETALQETEHVTHTSVHVRVDPTTPKTTNQNLKNAKSVEHDNVKSNKRVSVPCTENDSDSRFGRS